jgi:hypothetical protein
MLLLNPTRNLISPSDSLRAKNANGVVLSPETYSHTWTATNATITVVSEKYVHPPQYSLKVQPLNPSLPITLTLPSVIPYDTEVNGSQVQFHTQIYCSTGITAVAEIQNITESTSDSHQQLLTSGRWNAVWSPVIDVGIIDTSVDDIEFGVEITLTNHGGLVFYLSVPYIVNELGIYKNSFVYNMRKFIPTFIWDNPRVPKLSNDKIFTRANPIRAFFKSSLLTIFRISKWTNFSCQL